jgi:predicted acetyltransferase
MKLVLRELRPEDEAAFRMLIEAWEDSPGFNMLFGLVEGMRFESYLKVLSDMKHDALPGFVNSTALFGFVSEEIVGKVNFRHSLNEKLMKVGGHIGYGVVSEHRGKGYAREMLKQTLAIALQHGLKRVLITCDEDNVASAKVIEKNGGVFENYYDPMDGTSKKKRYWITLK